MGTHALGFGDEIAHPIEVFPVQNDVDREREVELGDEAGGGELSLRAIAPAMRSERSVVVSCSESCTASIPASLVARGAPASGTPLVMRFVYIW